MVDRVGRCRPRHQLRGAPGAPGGPPGDRPRPDTAPVSRAVHARLPPLPRSHPGCPARRGGGPHGVAICRRRGLRALRGGLRAGARRGVGRRASRALRRAEVRWAARRGPALCPRAWDRRAPQGLPAPRPGLRRAGRGPPRRGAAHRRARGLGRGGPAGGRGVLPLPGQDPAHGVGGRPGRLGGRRRRARLPVGLRGVWAAPSRGDGPRRSRRRHRRRRRARGGRGRRRPRPGGRRRGVGGGAVAGARRRGAPAPAHHGRPRGGPPVSAGRRRGSGWPGCTTGWPGADRTGSQRLQDGGVPARRRGPQPAPEATGFGPARQGR